MHSVKEYTYMRLQDVGVMCDEASVYLSASKNVTSKNYKLDYSLESSTVKMMRSYKIPMRFRFCIDPRSARGGLADFICLNYFLN